MSDYILQLDNVSKFFGPVIALNGVTLQLKRGEVHCLLGDNGAGKSTLIKTLAGVHAPDQGRYLVDDRPVRFASPKEALDLGIATVYQDLALVPLMSVARNFFMGREPRRKLFGLVPVMDHAEAARVAIDKLGRDGHPRARRRPDDRHHVRRREAVPGDRARDPLRRARADPRRADRGPGRQAERQRA